MRLVCFLLPCLEAGHTTWCLPISFKAKLHGYWKSGSPFPQPIIQNNVQSLWGRILYIESYISYVSCIISCAHCKNC